MHNMEEKIVSPSTDNTGGGGGGGYSETVDQGLEAALKRFIDHKKPPIPTTLITSQIRFNCATVNHLTAFLCSGVKNCGGHPVAELRIIYCTFENAESLCLLCDFFESNKSPETLEKIELLGLREAQIYKCLLSSIHNNKTIKGLSLGLGIDNPIQGKAGGEMVGNLLQRNITLTALTLLCCRVNVEFICAMRKGLLASRIRLESLELHNVAMGNEALNKLRRVYANTGQRQINTVLSELDLRHNDIEGSVGGNHLHGLLLTLSCLKKLNLHGKYQLGPAGAQALFSKGIAAAMGRLQSISMENCRIGCAGLAQMAASMPPDSSALVHLDLQRNEIEGDRGGAALFHLLRRCPRLETLLVYGNDDLGPVGAQAMAPALGHLCSLQILKMSDCDIQDGATQILINLRWIRCLKFLDLKCNNLPPATLAPLIDYLNGKGRSLEVLNLNGNGDLFGTTSLGQHGGFFDAIANHTAIQCLDVRECGLDNDDDDDDETDGQLKSAVFKNSSLVTINGTKAEYIRRDILMALIQTTISAPTIMRVSVWPMALGVCAPQFKQFGARPIVCLIQKMAEGDVFVHTAAVYRFEKVRASIRVQRWWRRGRFHASV